jgi:hypothetical protein
MTSYWLMKSEPEECSVGETLVAPNATVPWDGVCTTTKRSAQLDARCDARGRRLVALPVQSRRARHHGHRAGGVLALP